MRYVASTGERNVTIEAYDDDHVRHVRLNDVPLEVDWQAVGGALLQALPEGAQGRYSLLIGGRSYDCYVKSLPSQTTSGHRDDLHFEVEVEGQSFEVRVQDERTHRLAGLAARHDQGVAPITAPMPGLVSNVMAEVGQHVERGQTVIVLEAMKMENDLGAPRAGVVREIKVAKGQTVNQAQVLAIIGDAEGG